MVYVAFKHWYRHLKAHFAAIFANILCLNNSEMSTIDYIYPIFLVSAAPAFEGNAAYV